MKVKRLKNAIVLCMISVFLCFVALAGTTLAAGFNASKTNNGNKIQAQNDVKVYVVDNKDNNKEVLLNGNENAGSLKDYDSDTSDNVLTVTIKIVNTNKVAYKLYAVCTDDVEIAVTVGDAGKGTLSKSSPVEVASGNSSADGIKLTFTKTSGAFDNVALSLKEINA